MPKRKDIYFIRRTFDLARKAEGFTSPNPLVGALIVKNGKIIAYGYHKRCGLPHAEIEAIRRAGKECQGSTIYLNLEPCSHFGRTPPCLNAIIKNKFRRVVVAISDPNPFVRGRSLQKLKEAGIKVDLGLLKDEARKLNEVFFKNKIYNLPLVVAKVAQSLNGKIATKSGNSRWITAADSRKLAKSLRDKYDCVLVGVNTVIKDNPQLNGLKKIPYKVVIDPQLRIPLNSYLVRNHPEKLIIITSISKKNKLKKFPLTTKILVFIKNRQGIIPVKRILKHLYRLGIMSIFVEGGSQTLGKFFDERCLDKVFFFFGPKIIGGHLALNSIGGEGYFYLKDTPGLKDVEIKRLKKDILISGYLVYKKNRRN